MYTYYVIIKGTNRELALEELKTLWEVYNDEIIDLKHIKNTYFYFESEKKISKFSPLLKRLTLTNCLMFRIWTGKDLEQFEKEVEKSNFNRDSQTFAVLVKNISRKKTILEKDLAEPIWDSLKTPKVNLENPQLKIVAIQTNKELIITNCLFENEKDYLRRMPKQRPISMPYTLKSDMARVCINLLKLKEGTILDPFCGIGGILLEARDMNFKIIGNDISWNDLKYFKENYSHYFNGETPTRILADSALPFLKEETVNGIVTDIPYGRCSRKLGEDLYEGFLREAQKTLKKGNRIVIVYANFVEFKDIALKYFNEVVEINQYINRSMTRHILVLENTK